MTDANGSLLRIGTYNIHGWQGTDGRVDPGRILEVIEILDADILALQEVVSPKKEDAPCSLRETAAALGYHVTFGQTMLRPDARYGNALLSRVEPDTVVRHDISCPGTEPRGALEARFNFGRNRFRVVATHLGLHSGERGCQLDSLLPLLAPEPDTVTVLLGDLNDWFPFSRLRRSLRTAFGPQPNPRTFPGRFPILALDRVLVTPGHRLRSLKAVSDTPAKTASDHLPLIASVHGN